MIVQPTPQVRSESKARAQPEMKLWTQITSQSGVTLIELLAAVVLIGVILVPVFSVLGQSYDRTVHQGHEGQMLFYAEEVLERMKIRDDLASDESVDGTYYEIGQCTVNNGCVPSLSPDPLQFITYAVTVTESEYAGLDIFYDVRVQVYPREVDQREESVELLTVVRR